MRRRALPGSAAVVVDVLLMLLAAGTGIWREWFNAPDEIRLLALPTWAYMLAQVVAAVALLARRRSAVPVALANAALCLITPTQASIVAAYSLGAQEPDRRRGGGAFLLLLGAWLIGAKVWLLDDWLSGPLVLTLAMTVGMYIASRRNLLDALADRAARAEREQELLARQAVADERSRIASDMHDLVTNRLSMMVLQAGALRVATSDDGTRSAAEAIRAAGVQALDELRELVGSVRFADDSEGSSAATSPRELVAVAQRSGLDVELEERGRAEWMSPTVARAVGRVLQEALTNAAKHAAGASVSVRLRHTPQGSSVEVLSSGEGAPDRELADSGSGSGIGGLRARVAAVGGTLVAGPTDDGGFRIAADIPALADNEEESG